MSRPPGTHAPAPPSRAPRAAELAQAAFGGACVALFVAGVATRSPEIRAAGALALVAAYVCSCVVWIREVRAGRVARPTDPLLLKTDLVRIIAVAASTGFGALFGWIASTYTERGTILGAVAGGGVSGALIGIGRLRRALHHRLAPADPAPPAPPVAGRHLLLAAGLGAVVALGALLALGALQF